MACFVAARSHIAVARMPRRSVVAQAAATVAPAQRMTSDRVSHSEARQHAAPSPAMAMPLSPETAAQVASEAAAAAGQALSKEEGTLMFTLDQIDVMRSWHFEDSLTP